MLNRLSRRRFVRVAGLAAGTLAAGPLLAACGGPAAPPTSAPAPTTGATTNPGGGSTPAPTKASAAKSTVAAASQPAATTAPSAAGQIAINWWHHWASEPGKQIVISTFVKDYMNAHDNVKVNLRWWEKSAMYPVAKDAFIAGKGFPDIMYGPPDEFITAGWYEDLTNLLDWTQFNDGAKERTQRTLGGKVGIWDPPLEGASEEIYYNPKVFDKVGATVPTSRQYTSDEFYAMSAEIRKAGFDPLAQGIGDRNYPGREVSYYALLAVLGGDDAKKLLEGKLPWTTDGVSEALDWVAKMCKIPCMPPTFSTMTLAEAHQYFNTPPPGKALPRAAMFFVGAWYTGRAFQPASKGGEPDDFRCSFLKYPTFTNGKGNGLMWGGGGSGGGSVASGSKQKDTAGNMIHDFMNIKYGSLWIGDSYEPTELKSDPKLIPSGNYQWYGQLYSETHKDQQYVPENYTIPPALDQALTATLNEGLPENQITVDKAIQLLETARKQK